INPFHELEIKRLQPLTRSDVHSGHQDRVYRLVELIARLLALVVFEVEFALAKVVVGALDNLIHTGLVLLNLRLDFTSRRANGSLALDDCWGKKCDRKQDARKY